MLSQGLPAALRPLELRVPMRKVSNSTIGRLSLYLRVLTELAAEGSLTVSSEVLAEGSQTSAAQVRKDLSSFGTFGKRGRGYAVPELRNALRGILGLERRWRVALVGAGRLGAALLGYQDFGHQGFDIEVVIDTDPSKVGTAWNGRLVRPERELEALLRCGVDIVIVAVPGEAAQGVVDRVVAAGVRAILNFAPTKLKVPSHVTVKTVNMTLELEGLSYALANGARGPRRVMARTAAFRGE
jgi:redox-sensing transcriptional repressor